MGYLLARSLPFLVTSDRSDRDSYTTAFPDDLNRPPAAFPHLAFLFSKVSRRTHPLMLTHVGVVSKRGHRVTDREQSLMITNVCELPKPISTSTLQGALRKLHSDAVAAAINERDGVLTQAADEAIVDAIVRLLPGFESTLLRLRRLRQEPVRSVGADRWELGLDAIRTALRLGDFDTRQLRTWEVPDDPTASVLAGIKKTSEKDLIAHDLEVLPGWTPRRRRDTHVQIFSDGKRHMHVVNVDIEEPERVLGADLIYYHVEAKSGVLVQYKKLEDHKEVRVNPHLESQLDRMEQLSEFSGEPQSHAEWRLGKDFCYLKLCRTKTASGEIDPNNAELLPGLYLPLSYVRLAHTRSTSQHQGQTPLTHLEETEAHGASTYCLGPSSYSTFQSVSRIASAQSVDIIDPSGRICAPLSVAELMIAKTRSPNPAKSSVGMLLIKSAIPCSRLTRSPKTPKSTASIWIPESATYG
ncbi:hypothetical protein [Nocardia sp. BMG51109]|uniref:hypothetical protein n=1 Tax=Nocardia sp. BMG51109 TaxID=1056816 RepID=UPI0012EC7DF4|nr:hypothetical protein [Nocardia sp. BMG51109]